MLFGAFCCWTRFRREEVKWNMFDADVFWCSCFSGPYSAAILVSLPVWFGSNKPFTEQFCLSIKYWLQKGLINIKLLIWWWLAGRHSSPRGQELVVVLQPTPGSSTKRRRPKAWPLVTSKNSNKELLKVKIVPGSWSRAADSPLDLQELSYKRIFPERHYWWLNKVFPIY